MHEGAAYGSVVLRFHGVCASKHESCSSPVRLAEAAARKRAVAVLAKIGDPKIDSNPISIDLIQQQWTNVKNKQVGVVQTIQWLGVWWTAVLQNHVPLHLKKVCYIK
jgi:hypothetical protein